MKKVFFLFISLFVIAACSKKEVKLEAFSAEAFAYDIGDGTAEVNATVRVKGFTQIEKNDNYNAEVSYVVDLVRPDNSVKSAIFKYDQKSEKNEAMLDIPLEAQFLLDSTSKSGTYTLVFKIEDKNSQSKTEAKVNFDLKWEL